MLRVYVYLNINLSKYSLFSSMKLFPTIRTLVGFAYFVLLLIFVLCTLLHCASLLANTKQSTEDISIHKV